MGAELIITVDCVNSQHSHIHFPNIPNIHLLAQNTQSMNIIGPEHYPLA